MFSKIMAYFQPPKTEKARMHYYGDIVRKFFIAGGVIMIITFPFVVERLSVSVYASIFATVFIGLFAGITNPAQKWSNVLNTIISVIAVVVFEYYAVDIYSRLGAGNLLFWSNQLLAIIFFSAFYFSTKTIRGMMVS